MDNQAASSHSLQHEAPTQKKKLSTRLKNQSIDIHNAHYYQKQQAIYMQ